MSSTTPLTILLPLTYQHHELGRTIPEIPSETRRRLVTRPLGAYDTEN